MNNIMLDIETLGTTPGAVICAIGAVRFDANGVGDKFYTPVDIDSCLAMGMHVEGGTLKWWMKQNDDARRALYDPPTEPMGLTKALLLLDQWMGDKPRVWGNGASFDNAHVSAAYSVAGLTQPWDYWQDACYRTIRRLWEHERVTPTIPHHAMHDAEAQALTLIAIANEHTEANIL